MEDRLSSYIPNEQQEESNFDSAASTKCKITPIYGNSTKESYELCPTILGRRELATLWWKHCPNQCQTHLRRKNRTVCRQFCKPLCETVGLLSRQLIQAQGTKWVPHERCRFPELVHIAPVEGRNPSSDHNDYILTIGTEGQVWMRFRIVMESSSKAIGATAGPKDTTQDSMMRSSIAALPPARDEEKTRPIAISSSPASESLPRLDSADSHEENSQGRIAQITPATKKRRAKESQDSASSGSCKRRLFDTQAHSKIETTERLSQHHWPTSTHGGTSTPLSSFLSMPMPHEGSQLSNSSNGSSLQEATQVPWPENKQLKHVKNLSLTEWKSLQNGKGNYCTAMANLIVARNLENDACNSGVDDQLWLPAILDTAQIDPPS